MPQSDATMPGAVVISGNDITHFKVSLATKKKICATDHIRPLTKAGTMQAMGSFACDPLQKE